MIRIYYERELPRLTLEGHAAFDRPGRDIVCAAASILVHTLRSCIGAGELEQGRARLQGREEDRAAFDTVLTGFRLLEKGYPRCIRVLEGAPVEERTDCHTSVRTGSQ